MKPFRWLTIFTLGVYLLTQGVVPLYAENLESSTPLEKTLLQRLEDLEREVALLRRQKEVDQEVQFKKEAETPVVVAGKEGFSLKSKDNNFSIKLKGQIQGDSRLFFGDNTSGGSDTFLLRKVRPILEGTVFKYFDYRLMPDFGGGTTSLQDAYIDFKYWRQASLRVGKFKGPVGLERLQSDAYNLFPELSLASNLVPNRDVGIDLYGDFFEGALSYDLGVFNGSTDGSSNDSDNHDSKDFEGRIFSQPFKNTTYDALNGLGLGVGGSFGNVHGTTSSPNLPSYRTFGQQTFFSYRSDGTAAGTTIANGQRYRFAPQWNYYYGPFGLLGEYVFSSQEVTRGTSSRADITNTAGNLSASYVLTGENASYSGVVPRSDFDPTKKTWGAFELAARFDWFQADDKNFAVFANQLSSAKRARGWGAGLNWYLNKNLKAVSAFEQTFFDGGGPLGEGGKNRNNENALISRLQLVF